MKGQIAATKWLCPVLPIAAIVVLGLLVYANTFEGPFVFDDQSSIQENLAIRDWTDLGSLWRSVPTRFVLHFSLALNYRLGGFEVWGYHLVNLAIHLGTALLAYGLVRLIYASPWARSQPPEAIRRGSQVALLSALVFVAHPVQTQAVTYVVQRAESLAAFFYLLALVLYAKGRQLFFSSKLKAQSSKPKAQSSKLKAQSSKQLSAFSFWLSALFCAALGMLTKETVASLPAALLLYEVCFLRSSTPPPFSRSLTVTAPVSSLAPPPLGSSVPPPPSPSASLRSRLRFMVAARMVGCSSDKLPLPPAPPPFFRSPAPRLPSSSAPQFLRSLAPLLPFCLLSLFPLLLSTGGEMELPSQPGALSRWSYLVTQVRVLVTYLRLLLLPIGQNLDYDYPAHDSLGDPVVLGSLLLLASLPVLAVWAFRRRRVLAFAILWFLVTLSVTSSVIPILDVVFEHRLYLATLGYGLFLSYVLLRIGERWGEWGGRGALAVLFLLVAAYALAAHQRNRVWGDEVGLWRDCVAKSPLKARPHNNLGLALTEQGHSEEAVEVLRRAIRLKPNYPEAYNNLGMALIEQRRYEEAVEELVQAIRLKPYSPDAHYNLGLAYQNLHRFDPAIQSYRRAIDLRPRYGKAFNNLGNIYVSKGLLEESIEEYVSALKVDQNNKEAAHNLKTVSSFLVTRYLQRLSQDPADLDMRHQLAALFLRSGDWVRAIQQYEEIVRRAPKDLIARNNLGFAYGDLGEWDRAILEQRQVLEQDPGFVNGYYGLAQAYEKKGMAGEAAAAWEEYLRRSPPNNPWVPQARKHLQELRAGRQR